MEVIRTAAKYAAECHDQRTQVHPIGLVPTMGSLHEGHLSLIRRANAERDFVIVYSFVNPLQFGEGEDFETYPRDEDQDLAKAEQEGVDLVFIPTVEEMYPAGYPPAITVDPGAVGERLEGASRPGHFRGVLTVVARLFDLTGGPCRAFFGEKDAQQLFLITQMARQIQPDVEVVGCPTIRESDGLAMSSRNSSLKPDEREAATCLFRGLQAGARAHLGGEKDANILKAEIARIIGAEPLAKLDYVAIVDEDTFDDVAELERPVRALVAAKFGITRLIDNLRLG